MLHWLELKTNYIVIGSQKNLGSDEMKKEPTI